jgi:hypothetical protein
MEVTFFDAINNGSVGTEMMNGQARDLCMYVRGRFLSMQHGSENKHLG